MSIYDQNPDTGLPRSAEHPELEDLYFGPEFQFGRRENFKDGFSANDYRLQFSTRYSFSHKTGGGSK